MSWSNGQKIFTMTMAKISKLPWSKGLLLLGGGRTEVQRVGAWLPFTPQGSKGQIWPFLTMTMAKIQELPWSNGQNWSILTIDHGKIKGVMVMVNFFDH